MLRSLHVSIPLILLLALALLALPIIPSTDTASVEMGPTQETVSTRTLLGENLAKDKKEEAPSADAAENERIRLTVPKLGLKNVVVRTGGTQADLDREGIIRLDTSGVPWEEGSNTFITGHALGFEWTRVQYAFRDLEKMEPGDEIFIRDDSGKKYTFRVYDRMTVRPSDYWVTYPEPGRTLISLQSCVPIPTFENRLVVRGELVS